MRRGTPYRGATRARDQVQGVERRKRDNLSDRYQDGWIGKEDRDGILLNAVDRDGTKMYSDSEEEYPHMTSSKVGRNSHKTEKNQKGNQEGLPNATETQEAGLVGDKGSPGKPTAEAHGTQLELHTECRLAHAPKKEDPQKHLGWDPNTRFQSTADLS